MLLFFHTRLESVPTRVPCGWKMLWILGLLVVAVYVWHLTTTHHAI